MVAHAIQRRIAATIRDEKPLMKLLILSLEMRSH